MSNYRRHFRSGQIVFATVVTYRRRPWLRTPMAKHRLLNTMREVRAYHGFRNQAFVILNDHMHWMFAPDAGVSASRIISAVKRNMTVGRPCLAGKPLWQPRFWDHIIRDDYDFQRHLDYIHYNPVKHGIACSPAQYPWSSFRAWLARGVYTEDWGSHEPEVVQGMELE